ncbi:MAG TPA: beta-phosphoglucomutase family hydrolase [Woeseiaceae bacterium]|nr:beta-phosphoglucomutase family hydrolase [Woeseiaceae bacterium]
MARIPANAGPVPRRLVTVGPLDDNQDIPNPEPFGIVSSTGTIVTLSPSDYDAVLFDLDGVLTRTADVHAAAWKRLFDEFLRRRAEEGGEAFVPFDVESDYRRYVDGKPRYDGVRTFLASRGIELPEGAPDDAPDAGTVQALGGLKDRHFLEHLEKHGVGVYEPAVALVRSLRREEIATAVVSSSANCATVLDRAGIAELFDATVDGVDLRRLRLRGKPAPDAFLEAARRLRVEPTRAAVVEDAVAGVAAGNAGRFGLVIGVDRLAQSKALRAAGAHLVVTSLAQVQVAAESPSAWSLRYENFEPAREGTREALCALGNGYFETRGAAVWSSADDLHYPGTYVAGVYNRMRTEIADRVVESEHLVNFPNWLSLGLRPGGGEWFDELKVTILSYAQELDLKRGMLSRTLRFEDAAGRRSALSERRLVSMADMHAAALELSITAENWSGEIELCTALDGRVINAGAVLYRRFNNRHLVPVASEVYDGDNLFLLVRTSQSRVHVAQAARTRVFRDGSAADVSRSAVEEAGYAAQHFSLAIAEGETLTVEKTLALYTSRDPAISECALEAHKALARAPGFAEMMSEHVVAWRQLWRRFDMHLRPAEPRFALNIPMLLRLNIFHLLQTVSQHSIGLDIGVPARGWTGEAYLGHIFWDELFIFPTLNLRMPEITRSLLMYRYRRLPEARAAAAAAGLRGAMFPWQSGSDGQEETQELNLNPRSLRWMPDNTYLQRHVGSAVACNVWHYFQVTADTEFLQFYGAELILEIARFWSSLATFNERRGRYEIGGVMGPDEFHDAYPNAAEPGLNNNAYTNVMAVWTLCRALEVLDLLPPLRSSELTRKLGLQQDEIDRWEDISRRMFVPFHEGLISQFEGYENLAELDWDAYRARYGNIQRLELILEAENDSANRYKVGKQPDVMMLFYVFSAEELTELFSRIGYDFDPATIPAHIDYYDARSSNGSTLSRVVHAWVLARSDRPRALRYFAEALQSDVSDIQEGTTAEGVHLGAMAGTVDLVQRVSLGIVVSGDTLQLNPRLPAELERLDLRIRYRSQLLDLRLTHDRLTVRSRTPGAAPIRLGMGEEGIELEGGAARQFDLPPP